MVAALSATTYHPTQVVLRGVVDQLLFGERPDPLGAASQVAGRIGEDPLPALRAIREALVVPYAALLVDGVTAGELGHGDHAHPHPRPRRRAASWWSGCGRATCRSRPATSRCSG